MLTPEGKRFYHLARRLATMDRQLRELAGPCAAPALRFGATPFHQRGVMPSLLPALAGRFPFLPIRMVTANTAALLRTAGKRRAGFCADRGQFRPAALRLAPLYAGSLSGAVPGRRAVQPFYPAGRMPYRAAAAARKGQRSRDIFESECLAHSLHPGDFARLHEIDSIPVILQMAAQDRGVTFAYECAARPCCAQGCCRPFPLPILVSCVLSALSRCLAASPPSAAPSWTQSWNSLRARLSSAAPAEPPLASEKRGPGCPKRPGPRFSVSQRFFSASTLSVLSQAAARSSRPMWP